ncbi:MAG: GNAT family N-acetyltransferase [Candidatus Gastranaerophilales bacterium]|nr:GNAT family N-acetyltransferase [Candidatus Gastranaerophilales bacterium]
MANITIYKVEPYKTEYKKVFSGIYNDFKQNAFSYYNFELEPISYDKFVKSLDDGLLNCLILFEDDIPTGFLVYTTLISESIELNIIHCIGTENLNAKRKLLLEKFLELNRDLLKDKVITYPLTGKQSAFSPDIEQMGFKIVNTSVMAYNLSNIDSINTLKEIVLPELPNGYSITNWKTSYSNEIAGIILQAFKESSDSLFDSRFKSIPGCRDIVNKITQNVYGEFLPEITKVLLYKKRPVGICFANLTNKTIANVPIAAILKKHRNYGFGKILLKKLVEDLLTSSISNGWMLKEINASCDSDNIPSVNMYSAIGFTKQYTYPLAYY